MRRWAISAGSLLFYALPALAFTVPSAPTNYVNDYAHVLNDQTVQGLNSELASFEASTSNQIAVVTVPDMSGDYIEHYAADLFQKWGIGSKDKDNGVLLLLSVEEHKIRIEVGYGLEGALPDSIAQSIINNDLTPNLKAGDFDTGVMLAAHHIEAATQNEYQGTESTNSSDESNGFDLFGALFGAIFIFQWFVAILARSKSWWAGGIVGGVLGGAVWLILGLTIYFGVIGLFGLIGLGLLFDYIISNAYAKSKSSGIKPPWWIGGGGMGGRGGGGFGGFGGGSSGGGGASGGW